MLTWWPIRPAAGRRPTRGSSAGTLFREALGVLRNASAPMLVTQIGYAVLAANNLIDVAGGMQYLDAVNW